MIWFWAIYMLSTDKRGLSALCVSKKIGISYWKAWTMLHKIKRAVRERDSKYKLAGIVEMDDSFFGGPKKVGDKRGLGSSKTAVIVEASINREGIFNAEMTVVDHVDSAAIQGLIKADVKEN